jgi:hypothetical protein
MLNAFGQIQIDTTKYYDFYNLGTVKKVTNDEVCAIVVFVSGPNSNWSSAERKQVLKRDKGAFVELRRNLKKFNVDFNLKFHIANPTNDFKVDSVYDFSKITGYKKGDGIKRDFNSENAEKIWEYYTTINNSLSFFKEKTYLSYSGGYFLLVYHYGAGRTNASPHFTYNYKDAKTPEFITIFQQTMNIQNVKKRVTAHEVLHLYGAWDLYDDDYSGHDKKTHDKIKEKFPKSIMRSLKNSTIDPITAWRIGLNNKPEVWFFDIVPKAYRKNSYDKNGNFKQ